MKAEKFSNFAVSVLMIGVGRLVGDANGKKSHQCRDQIESGVRGFRQNSQRAGRDPYDNFQAGDHQAPPAPSSRRRSVFRGASTRELNGGLDFWHQASLSLWIRSPPTPSAALPGCPAGHATMTFVRNFSLEDLDSCVPSASCVSCSPGLAYGQAPPPPAPPAAGAQTCNKALPARARPEGS